MNLLVIYPRGGWGSLRYESRSRIVPSIRCTTRSAPSPLDMDLAYVRASSIVSKRLEARSAPSLLTAHPPLGFDTTWYALFCIAPLNIWSLSLARAKKGEQIPVRFIGHNTDCELSGSSQASIAHHFRRVPLKLAYHSGAFTLGFHLMLQPMLGLWFGSTALSSNTASIAARKSLPVTGMSLPGLLSSICPR